jgi:simple sugar transport system substrate-binding protein
LPTPTLKVWAYDEMTVGFIQAGSEGQWYINNTTSFKELAQQLGITLKLFDAQFNLEAQIVAFRNFIQDPDVNVIVLNAIEPTGWDKLLKQAQAASKVVIFEDQPIAVPEDLYTTLVGSDFVEEGRKAAVEMCKLLNGSQKNVWELTGYVADLDAYRVNKRGAGFREKMGECGITISPTLGANQSNMEGEAAMGVFLKNTNIQGLFLQNEYLANSAIRAIKAVGLKPGIDIKIVSIDATLAVVNGMRAGDINACVEYSPLLAPQVYEAALRALNGELLPKRLPVQERVLYAKDVDHSRY